MGVSKRFHDATTYLAQFRDRVRVVCPRCEGKALVRAGPDARGTRDGATLSCLGCGLSKAAAELPWAGPAVGWAAGRCGRCGAHHSERVTGRVRHDLRRRLPCACGADLELSVSWHPIRDRGHDPWFGLPLLLRASVGPHTLWAYNCDHLRFLGQFVAADLREREPGWNATLASRLPRWMKSAKHREQVVEVIERLLRECTEG